MPGLQDTSCPRVQHTRMATSRPKLPAGSIRCLWASCFCDHTRYCW